MFELQLNRLFPCNVYPEKQLYETVVPQLYGPVDGLVLASVTDGGLTHSQTSVYTKIACALKLTFFRKHIMFTSDPWLTNLTSLISRFS